MEGGEWGRRRGRWEVLEGGEWGRRRFKEMRERRKAHSLWRDVDVGDGMPKRSKRIQRRNSNKQICKTKHTERITRLVPCCGYNDIESTPTAGMQALAFALLLCTKQYHTKYQYNIQYMQMI